VLLLNKDKLQDRLESLDKDAALLFNDNIKYHVVIAGSSSLILMGYTARATSDIDIIEAAKALHGLFGKYQMNVRISAYENSFLYNYQDRLKLLHNGIKVDFYSVSLEDVVVSKLCATREQDNDDLVTVAKYVDWKKLEELVNDEDELRTLKMCDRQYLDFKRAYEDYIKDFRP